MSLTPTIFKYILPPIRHWKGDEVSIPTLAMPEPLYLAKMDGDLCLWVRGFDIEDGGSLRLRVCGTGHPAPAPIDADHVSTLIEPPFVWHFFAFKPGARR